MAFFAALKGLLPLSSSGGTAPPQDAAGSLAGQVGTPQGGTWGNAVRGANSMPQLPTSGVWGQVFKSPQAQDMLQKAYANRPPVANPSGGTWGNLVRGAQQAPGAPSSLAGYFGRGSQNGSGVGTVMISSPDGSEQQSVPEQEAEHWLRLGGRRM